MKKTLALLLIASVAASILVGCDPAPKDDAVAPANSATSADAVAPPKDKTPKMDDAD